MVHFFVLFLKHFLFLFVPCLIRTRNLLVSPLFCITQRLTDFVRIFTPTQ